MGIRGISNYDRLLIMPGVGDAVPARQQQRPRVAPAESSPPADKTDKPETQQLSPDAKSVRDVSRVLNEILQSLNWNIRIRIDEDTDRIVTQIVDPENDEIVTQIPPQELLEIVSRVKELVGLLLDRKA